MKKLIKISLIIVVVMVLLQTTIGEAFMSAGKMASFDNPQYAAAPSSGQSIQILICTRSRLVGCVIPNVGWNS